MEAIAIKEQVRERYAGAARRAQGGAGCCGTSGTSGTGGCCGGAIEGDAASSHVRDLGYSAEQIAALPAGAVAASLGCGNPHALLDLREGETVLDLGSGGGIDVLLSARRVGPTGRAIGLDMTDEMLALARQNAAEAGVANVEFVKGEMEAIPLPDASVDTIISNCVVNLSPDKDAVLRESYRVLRPGGRFAISDIVAAGPPVPPDLRADLASWTACVAGALHEADYRAALAAAGFRDVEIVPVQTYGPADDLDGCGCGAGSTGSAVGAYEQYVAAGGRLVSAYVRATKPAS